MSESRDSRDRKIRRAEEKAEKARKRSGALPAEGIAGGSGRPEEERKLAAPAAREERKV